MEVEGEVSGKFKYVEMERSTVRIFGCEIPFPLGRKVKGYISRAQIDLGSGSMSGNAANGLLLDPDLGPIFHHDDDLLLCATRVPVPVAEVSPLTGGRYRAYIPQPTPEQAVARFRALVEVFAKFF